MPLGPNGFPPDWRPQGLFKSCPPSHCHTEDEASSTQTFWWWQWAVLKPRLNHDAPCLAGFIGWVLSCDRLWDEDLHEDRWEFAWRKGLFEEQWLVRASTVLLNTGSMHLWLGHQLFPGGALKQGCFSSKVAVSRKEPGYLCICVSGLLNLGSLEGKQLSFNCGAFWKRLSSKH